LYKEHNSFLSSNSLNPFTSWEEVILPKRDVAVWLPKEYDLKEFHGDDFPILYCHDGQNGEHVSTNICFHSVYYRLDSCLLSCSRIYEL